MASKIKVTNKNYDAFMKRLYGGRNAGRLGVVVGLLSEGPGGHEHQPKIETQVHDIGGEYKNVQVYHAKPAPLTVVDIGIIHEFGLGVPERSFIRAWCDANTKRVQAAMRRLLTGVVQGKYDRAQALTLLGLWIQGEIQKYISRGVPPLPNAQATIDRKGSSRPLIDTGQLRAAVSFALRKFS